MTDHDTTTSEPRPLYWSVRRELWENRFVWIAPLIVAAIVLFASTVTMLVAMFRASGAGEYGAAVRSFKMAPAPIMFATFVVAVFYCLDALHGERRDRSILFWKSLPVSDRTTILAKAIVPFVVLPLIAVTFSLAALLVMLVVGTPVVVTRGLGLGAFFGRLGLGEGTLVMLYGLTAHVLWFAPVYGWLLLVSAWARRAPLLWAVLPLLAVSAVERIVAGSWHIMKMLEYRATGGLTEAFIRSSAPAGHQSYERLAQLQPLHFLSRPGLWLGLAFAEACIAAAIRLRRRREPV